MKKTLISIIFFLLPLTLFAKAIDWQQNGHVSYSLQKKYSPVLGRAAEMFSNDMAALTGRKAKSSGSGNVLVFQLDKASNKEMKSLGQMKIPVFDFITKKDAFWIGVRNGKIIVVGSNGRGAAYGLLQVSQLPSALDDKYETKQIP